MTEIDKIYENDEPKIWENSLPFRFLRLALFFSGTISVIMFFFSFIGILIGILFFGVFHDTTWKRHGIVLVFAASVSPFIAHKGSGLPPLYLAILSGWAILVVYFVSFLLWKFWISKLERPKQWHSKFQYIRSNLPKWARISIMMGLIFISVFLWSNVSIDFGVMFDNRPHLLWVHAPSTVNVSAEFDVTVEAWDSYERLSSIYKGTVQFTIESYNLTTLAPISLISADLPPIYTFTGQNFGSDMAYEIHDGRDNGLHVFQMRINTPGIHYILVEDSLTQNIYYSNPVIVREMSITDMNIYWGDIHTHSMLSDGSGTAEHSFYYAQYIACLDFHALTDHGEILTFIPGGSNILESATNLAYKPHQFVTFHGIEWTKDDPGHYTCIFSGDQLIKNPVLSYLSHPTPDALWKALDDYTELTGYRALALPHHTVKTPYILDWTYINPKYVKIAEVTSTHGESLFEPRHPLSYRGSTSPPPGYVNGSSIVDALRMGHQLALYAASDEHGGHPGHTFTHTPAYVGHQRPWSIWFTRNDKPYPGGLTAVYAQNLTREAIFSGLEDQRIFANSDHGRPLIHFTINDTEVGGNSTLEVENADISREIKVFLAQDGAPPGLKNTAASVTPNWTPNWNAVIEIIKNGQLLIKIPVNGPVSTVSYIDTTPITGASYGKESCVQRGDQFYINDYSDNPVDPDTLNTAGADFYFVRIVGENGRTSYAGPIWVFQTVTK